MQKDMKKKNYYSLRTRITGNILFQAVAQHCMLQDKKHCCNQCCKLRKHAVQSVITTCNQVVTSTTYNTFTWLHDKLKENVAYTA